MGVASSRTTNNNFRQASVNFSNTDVSQTGKSSSQKILKASSLIKFSFKRKSSEREHVRPFEELIRSWPVGDLNLLITEFEADATLLEFQKRCDLTRKLPKSCIDELEKGSAAAGDFNVIFKHTKIRTNQAFLAQRCKHLNVNANIDDDSENFHIQEKNFQKFEQDDIEFFLKSYIYNEIWPDEKGPELLAQLCTEFGCHKKLEDDIKQMYKNDLKNGDLIIEVVEGKSEESINCKESFEIRCSSLIAASRSSIIRSLLLKKFAEEKDSSESSRKQKRIIFSELIFPRAFAPLFISFLYTDRLDWSLAPKTENSISSLSQAKAITKSGKSPDVQLARALQIIEIARFFEVTKMIQACEDVVVENLSCDNVVNILQWSSAYNSKYIATHAFRFVEQEFSRIAVSNSLYDLTSNEMTELTRSQFLQTTELELLDACCRWGEHALLKKMEEREPNLVADTCHSISRRGLKKSEKSGDELREILKPLAENIRKDYALPPFHQDLTNAYNKGILEQSPLTQDLLVSSTTSEINPDLHWLKPEQDSPGPRYYRPYHTAALKRRSFIDPNWIDNSFKSALQLPISLEFTSLYPDIVKEDVFSKAKERISSRTKNPDFMCLPRNYHKRKALEMITRQTLIELDIPEECLSCRLILEDTEKPATPPDVLPQTLSCFDIF